MKTSDVLGVTAAIAMLMFGGFMGLGVLASKAPPTAFTTQAAAQPEPTARDAAAAMQAALDNPTMDQLQGQIAALIATTDNPACRPLVVPKGSLEKAWRFAVLKGFRVDEHFIRGVSRKLERGSQMLEEVSDSKLKSEMVTLICAQGWIVANNLNEKTR